MVLKILEFYLIKIIYTTVQKFWVSKILISKK